MQGTTRGSRGGREGWRGRKTEGRDRRRRVERNDDAEHERRSGDRHEDRPEEGEADRERRLERQVEHAHRGLELGSRDDARNHRRLGRRQDNRRQADPEIQDQEHRDVRSGDRQSEGQQGPDRVRDDQCDADVEPIDEHAGESGKKDRRDQEGHHEGAHGRVRSRRREDEDRQRIQRHVAADLGRRLDEPQPPEGRVAQDRDGAFWDHRPILPPGKWATCIRSPASPPRSRTSRRTRPSRRARPR